ncbi:hypothetical protein J8273_5099 [Carpediemonas membranifera]|uniref:AMP-activated protein kinase glycogen-binding domain-containing protein n=1 Tax=Carpediemonas membranifera TaxID=201153 RepID=A0A8J6ATN2_9EUKA|nr:hypothetical protein J8273_5099 [Carpediemonas membranifera]|eukprot:KAG9392120.1 hypothetical protein J8273_5099 [Carpediemonas membranifera]
MNHYETAAVVFKYRYPASAVSIYGSWNHKSQTPLHFNPKLNCFIGSVEIPIGSYHFVFNVDNQIILLGEYKVVYWEHKKLHPLTITRNETAMPQVDAETLLMAYSRPIHEPENLPVTNFAPLSPTHQAYRPSGLARVVRQMDSLDVKPIAADTEEDPFQDFYEAHLAAAKADIANPATAQAFLDALKQCVDTKQYDVQLVGSAAYGLLKKTGVIDITIESLAGQISPTLAVELAATLQDKLGFFGFDVTVEVASRKAGCNWAGLKVLKQDGTTLAKVFWSSSSNLKLSQAHHLHELMDSSAVVRDAVTAMVHMTQSVIKCSSFFNIVISVSLLRYLDIVEPSYLDCKEVTVDCHCETGLDLFVMMHRALLDHIRDRAPLTTFECEETVNHTQDVRYFSAAKPLFSITFWNRVKIAQTAEKVGQAVPFVSKS